MSRYVFKLPDVGEGTAEAEIVAWHVKPGDHVEEDQNLVDVMTEKATVEMTSPVAGKVATLHGEPGDMAQVGAPLVEFEVEGVGEAAAPTATPAAEAGPAPSAPPHAPAPDRAGEIPLASPAVRRRARDLGIDLRLVTGTGPDGHITHADLDALIASHGRGQARHAPTLRTAPPEGVEEVRLIGLRRRIAEKMAESKRRIPHYAYVEEIDMTELDGLRAHLNATRQEDQSKLTVLPFLMRALVKVLPEFPQVNARFDDEAGIIHRYAAIHVGIATQTTAGLLVPVVHHAEALDIWQSAAEVARLAAAVRDNRATRDELQGSTITITSLGPLGGLVTTPVINHPEVAIIAPNAIVERPVASDGQIVIRKMMNLSSSFDHRVVDGYDAARFIQRIKALLEHPALLFQE